MAGIWGGVYFLIFLLGIMGVIRWYLQNDGSDPELGKRGIFAMKQPKKKRTMPGSRPPQRF